MPSSSHCFALQRLVGGNPGEQTNATQATRARESDETIERPVDQLLFKYVRVVAAFVLELLEVKEYADIRTCAVSL